MVHLRYLLETRNPSRLLVANPAFRKTMVELVGRMHLRVSVHDLVESVNEGTL